MENTGKGEPQKNTSPLTLQQKALGAGMLYGKRATTEFTLAGQQRIYTSTLAPHEYQALVQEFQHDPFTKLAYGRQNLLAIMHDPRLPLEIRQDRVRRYTDAYLDLVTDLDHRAFPPDDRVRQGIPAYVPDGLSDMGGESEINSLFRSREKIRINKAQIFEQAKPLFNRIFSAEISKDVTSEQWKKWATEMVAHYVYTSMPYNYDDVALDRAFNFKSVPITDVADKRLAVCRHHALMTQVLLQTMGITSRLMKSELLANGRNLGPHANNAVRIEGQWYIIDSTNPDKSPDGKRSKMFMRALPERNLDLNGNQYGWDFTLGNGETQGYRTRSNMYYRIRDNAKDPAR